MPILEIVSITLIDITCVLIKVLYAFASDYMISSVKKLALNAIYLQRGHTLLKIQFHCVVSNDCRHSN